MDDDGAELDLEPEPRNLPILNLEKEDHAPEERAELGVVVTLVTVVEDPANGPFRGLLLSEDTLSLCLCGGELGEACFFIDERAGGGGSMGTELVPRCRPCPRGRRCGVLETWRPMAICSMVGGAKPASRSSEVIKCAG